jgi:hypothetical protein
MWKTLRVFHIPTPSAATTDKLQTRRYTNNQLGTKDRSGHPDESLALPSKSQRSYLYFPIGAKVKIKQLIADMSVA